MELIGLNPHAPELIFLSPVPASKMELFIHSTTRNAPYVHARLDLILELCGTFPIGTLSRAFAAPTQKVGLLRR